MTFVQQRRYLIYPSFTAINLCALDCIAMRKTTYSCKGFNITAGNVCTYPFNGKMDFLIQAKPKNGQCRNSAPLRLRICTAGFLFFRGYCYKVFPGPVITIDLAKLTCQFNGAALASIHSEAENEFIWRMMYGAKGPTNKYGWSPATVLIGGVQSTGARGFYWTDGSAVNYTNFAANQIKTLDRAIVMHTYMFQGLIGQWYRTADYVAYYPQIICKRPP